MNRLDLLADITKSVDAYRQILKKEGIDSANLSDWTDLPILTKKTYLLEHPVKALCRNGDFSEVHLIGASSGFGKSGTVYWPKRHQDEAAYVDSLGGMLKANYQTDQKRTLVLVCLAFGMWIGGMQLAAGMRQVAADTTQRLTLATPGLNLTEAAEVIKEFENEFEQIMVITNPSNVNIIMALVQKMHIDRGKGKFVFPVIGEFFSESARIKTSDFFGHSPDCAFSLWTGYGSADTGDLGVETTSSIALRKFFYQNPALSEEYFGTADTPMIFEKTPKAFIEIIDGEIVVTKDQFIPLIRYNTQDRGGILIKESLREIIPNSIWSIWNDLPDELLYVGGRTSDSVVFYGTNLITTDINHFLLSLSEEYAYGGLYHVKPYNNDGLNFFKFIIYTEAYAEEGLAKKYQDALLGYLKAGSLEFAAKYDTLSTAAGKQLIEIELKDVKSLEGALKHRFILE